MNCNYVCIDRIGPIYNVSSTSLGYNNPKLKVDKFIRPYISDCCVKV